MTDGKDDSNEGAGQTLAFNAAAMTIPSETPVADSAGAHGEGERPDRLHSAEDVQAPVAAAGQITIAGDARQLQLSLKVVF